MMRQAAATILLLLAAACAGPKTPPKGAPITVRAGVDRATATVNDELTYTIEVAHEPTIEVTLPEVGDRIEGLRIVDTGRDSATDETGRKVERRWYKLRGDIAGSYILPAVRIPYTTPEGEEKVAEAPQIFIELSAGEEKGKITEGLRDIKGIVVPPTPSPWPRRLGIAFLLLCAAAAGYAIYRYQTRPLPAPPPLPPHERFYADLAALERKNLLARGEFQAFYFELSEIFRRYVEGRFGFPCLEQTGEEILETIGAREDFTPEMREIVSHFIERTDSVKFAGRLPPREEIEEMLRLADRFVRLTRPEESEEAEDDEAWAEEDMEGFEDRNGTNAPETAHTAEEGGVK